MPLLRPGLQSGAGRFLPADATSTSELSSKYSASAFFCPRGASFTVMALAGFGLRGAAWCCASASAIATVSRSCRKNWRNRRCRRLIAAPGALSTSMINSLKLFSRVHQQKKGNLAGKRLVLLLLLLCVKDVNDKCVYVHDNMTVQAYDSL